MNLANILLQAAEQGSGLPMILMMVALFAIMYFFMIRPQQKKQKKLQEDRNALQVGDRVITAGGIHGKIRTINETNFIIEIANNPCVQITVEKTSIFAATDAITMQN